MSSLGIYFKEIIKCRPVFVHQVSPTGDSLKIFRWVIGRKITVQHDTEYVQALNMFNKIYE